QALCIFFLPCVLWAVCHIAQSGRAAFFGPSLTVPRYMNFYAFIINTLQAIVHVSRLPFLPIHVRGIFPYPLGKKWIASISMYHQLSNSGGMGSLCERWNKERGERRGR